MSVKAQIDTHEAVCAERYEAIRNDISALKGMFKWLGTTVAVTAIGAAGWGVSQTLLAAKSDHEAARARADSDRSQVQLLQSQIQTLTANMRPVPGATINVQPAPARDPMTDPAPTAAQPGTVAQ